MKYFTIGRLFFGVGWSDNTFWNLPAKKEENYQFLINLSIVSKLDKNSGKTDYALSFSFLWLLVKVIWI